uniref:DNA polymerase delta subunit 3 n=1 Tax=Cynoglossus semilaevis TaxID=244447 RepID=A0A3P8X769_CYNSE
MDELYLDNIDEYVNDHDKIVTYKWLSLTLGVHVNTAKQMLYHYLDHKRKESSAQLHATYLVSGKFVDKGQTVSLILQYEESLYCKARMSLIVSVHVYSVQKALLRDSSPLYSVDYDAVRDHLQSCAKYSAIRCTSAVPLSSVELQQARERQPAPTPEPVVKVPSVNGEASHPSKPSTKSQKGIMGMFSNKAAPKHQDSVTEVKLEQKEVEPPKSKAAAKVSPALNFFGNQKTKKPNKSDKADESLQSSSRLEQQQHQSSPPEKKPEAAAEESTKGSKKESRSKTKRTVDSDSEEEKMDKKKRRRIKKPEPDSSDEDSEKFFIISVPGGTKIRKRRRVLKPKTFVDDEGCIVTEKVYESESYSEAEDEAPVKQAPTKCSTAKLHAAGNNKEEEKKSQKKTSANTNKGTKQASIMGFFQKK